MEKQYLGDAVYVTYDGYNTVLTTENGIRILNEIYLDPYVVEKLLRYLQECKNQQRVNLNANTTATEADEGAG